MEFGKIVASNPFSTIKSVFDAELLPLFGIVQGLEQVDVPFLGFLRHTRRSVDGTLHVVLDVNTKFFCSRNVGIGRHAFTGELNQRLGLTGTVELILLGGVIDSRVNVIADQVLGHGTTARKRDVSYLVTELLLHHRGEDGILLTRASAANLPALTLGLDSLYVSIQISDALLISIYPQQEGIQRHAANRSEGSRIDTQPFLNDRGSVEAVQGYQQNMVVTGLVLEITQCFTT